MIGEAAILRIAERETSLEHAAEFEPITRGFAFAALALGPLCILAAGCVAWRLMAGAARRLAGRCGE